MVEISIWGKQVEVKPVRQSVPYEGQTSLIQTVEQVIKESLFAPAGHSQNFSCDFACDGLLNLVAPRVVIVHAHS